MKYTKQTPPGRITPLWIIASFLTLTEVALVYAVTQVEGGVQVALTFFVIAFALLISGGFFAILWNRPWVFYSPSEYGDVDPKQFLTALRDSSPAVATHLELAKSVEENPYDEDAKFALIDSMADEVESQFIILMHESGKDVPRYTSYIYETESGSSGSGGLSPYGKGNRIEGSGVARVSGNGSYWSLTDEGRRYAEWLIEKGRKCKFFWTPIGGWGTPAPGGHAEKSLSQRRVTTEAQQTSDGNAEKPAGVEREP